MVLRRMMDARVKPGHDECRHLDSRRTFATPPRNAPEPLMNLPPPWRAWGMPGARCTRGPVCTCSGRTHTSNNEYTGIARHSRTQWFYGLFRALLGDRALLPPSSADMFCLSPVGPTQLRELDASVGASGPHDFAVRCNRLSSARLVITHRLIARPAIPSRARRCRVHRIPT